MTFGLVWYGYTTLKLWCGMAGIHLVWSAFPDQSLIWFSLNISRCSTFIAKNNSAKIILILMAAGEKECSVIHKETVDKRVTNKAVDGIFRTWHLW